MWVACAVHALQAEHPWLLLVLARFDDKHLEGCETVYSNGNDDVAKHRCKQVDKQHAAYKQDCTTKALALTDLNCTCK